MFQFTRNHHQASHNQSSTYGRVLTLWDPISFTVMLKYIKYS
jgi:hypothetical protein